MRPLALVLLVLVATPSVIGGGIGPAPAIAQGPLNFITEPAAQTLFENVSIVTGENYTREDVDIHVGMDFRDLRFDAVGILFGGGTFEAQARITVSLELRALDAQRVNDAIVTQTRGAVNLTDMGVPLGQKVLTADEFRTLLVGEAIGAFQGEQERKVEDLISKAFPEMTVLSARVEWSQTDPRINGDGDDGGPPQLTEPPIRLDAVVDVQYLKRESLIGLIESARKQGSAAEAREEEARDDLLTRLKERQQAAFYERSAFSVLGITQLLDLSMDPGWDLVIDLTLPAGYTFEDASPDIAVDPTLRTVRMTLLAGEAGDMVSSAALVSISSRYLVSLSLLFIVFIVGAILRFPTIVTATAIRRAWRKRHAPPAATATPANPAAPDSPDAAE